MPTVLCVQVFHASCTKLLSAVNALLCSQLLSILFILCLVAIYYMHIVLQYHLLHEYCTRLLSIPCILNRGLAIED